MKHSLFSLAVFLAVGMNAVAQSEPNPPVIALMEELGTVYLTRRPAQKKKGAESAKDKRSVIVGVDFRPTAGSDPRKIADAVRELATLPDLESVLLLGKDVTDASADAVPASAKLTSVQFFNTGITDKGIAKLTRLKKLQQFKYNGMGLTDVGMKEVAKIRTLQTIVITDAKVTDVGVLALKGLPNLRRLTVENTEATQQAIDRLRESLRVNDFDLRLR